DIKNGADFADLASQYGEDGTAQRGGDLGFFGKGQMVGPFEEASFAPDEAGLIPNLIETDFGFHIVDITSPKTNLSYQIAGISRTLDPSEDTRNEILLQAEEFRSNVEDLASLQTEAEKDEAITVQKAEKLATNATNLGALNAAREVIRWSFNEAEVGDISEVFDINESNKYVIACLSTKSEKDESTIEIFRDQLQQEVIKELKAEQILKKLDASAKDLDAMADKYGADAQVNTSDNITLGTNVLQGAGFNPTAIGKVFSLKKGKRSAPFKDETGIFVLELVETTPAPKIADYSQYKDQLLQSAKQRIPFLLNQAIREMADVEDLRYKFY
ncbi:MAG: peptidylprolyl isomerase, partial [Bacteroidota bacterium]